MDNLLNKRVFLLDIEGVLCESIDNEIPLSLVNEFISSLRSNDIKIAIVTNISRNPKDVVLTKLQSMGISIQPNELYTSGSTTASIIKHVDLIVGYIDAVAFPDIITINK